MFGEANRILSSIRLVKRSSARSSNCSIVSGVDASTCMAERTSSWAGSRVEKYGVASVIGTVGAKACATVCDTVGAAAGTSVVATVGASVGDTVGASAAASVGATVGASDGATVGATAGASDGATVGASAGASVGATVGASEGATVGASAGASLVSCTEGFELEGLQLGQAGVGSVLHLLWLQGSCSKTRSVSSCFGSP